MLRELAKPVALLLSILSLLAVFHSAFLGTESDLNSRIYDTVALLVMAAGIAFLGGILFRDEPPMHDARSVPRSGSRPSLHFNPRAYRGLRLVSNRRPGARPIPRRTRFIETFPVRVFCWATGLMAVLFVVARYLEEHYILYRDTHW